MQITANGKILDLTSPVVMGVLNLNKDSFYAGSRVTDLQEIVDRAGNMISHGARIIDIGGMTTKPASVAPPVEEEIERIARPLEALREAYPEVFISIDTYRRAVLDVAVAGGVDIVNDISGGNLDDAFIDGVAAAGLPYILMHMQGSPDNMQDHPSYDVIVLEILTWLKNKQRALQGRGIHDIIVDPGFGFGKTISDNYLILKHLRSFEILECPILAGISRKSMLYKLLNITPDQALNATTSTNTIALMNGANILRVHDVAEAIECIRIFAALEGA